MTTTPTPDAPLSPTWAFVMHLRKGTKLTPEELRGRVEHILSGQAALFTSLEELRTLMAHVLTSPGDDGLHPP